MKALLLAAALLAVGCIPTIPRVCTGPKPRTCGTATPVLANGDTIYLVTVEHIMVIDSDGKIRVRVRVPPGTTEGEWKALGKLFSSDAFMDLAVVEVEGYPGKPMKLCDTHVNERVRVVANRGVVETATGRVILLNDEYVYTDIEARDGWSGAPIISTKRDCVVGILQANLYKTQTFGMQGSIAIRSRYILPLLKKANYHRLP